MDRASERADRIAEHIDHERALLRSNLEELEDRVRSVVDWRRQFSGNTALWLGCAFGGGLLIALMSTRRVSGPRRPAYRRDGEALAAYPDYRRREISRAWRTIESALISVAASKLKELLVQFVPGFGEHVARREEPVSSHDPSSKDRGPR